MHSQGFLIAHGAENVRVSHEATFQRTGLATVTWADCHAQQALLLLHLALIAIPLMAKLWRVWCKIREAETHKLHLWDPPARRLALRQSLVLCAFVRSLRFELPARRHLLPCQFPSQRLPCVRLRLSCSLWRRLLSPKR